MLMKHRFLYLFLSILLLLSANIGTTVQKAVFSFSSEDVKIITYHSSVQYLADATVNESKVSGKTFSRSQKRSNSFHDFSSAKFIKKASFAFNFSSFCSSTLSTTRILLLPKHIKNLILLQTLF